MLNGVIPLSWSGYIHVALRVMTGLLLLEHGTSKLLNFPHVDYPEAFPMALRYFTGGIEIVGGILIIIGLYTRMASFILAGFMAVAYFMVHAPMGFFPILNMGEAAVLYCFIFLYLAVIGAGPYSLDASRK